MFKGIIYKLKGMSYKYMRVNIGRGTKIIDSSIGEHVRVGRFCFISNSILSDFVQVGSNTNIIETYMGKHSYIGKNGVVEKAKIGNFSSISWNVTIGAGEHKTNILTTHEMLFAPYHGFIKEKEFYDPRYGEVIIGNDVWIGANVVIKRNIKIGDGAVIGAGAVVTKNIPDYAIAVGVPAKVIRYRFSDEIIKELKEIKWWDWPEEIIKANIGLFAMNPEEDEVIEKMKLINNRLKNIR